MAFGVLIKDSGGVDPIEQTYVPDTGFVATEGSSATYTDGSSDKSTPATVHRAARTVLLLTSAATTTNTTNGPYNVGPFDELAVDIDITATSGTGQTIQYFIDRIGADSVAYNIWFSSVVSATGHVSASIGSGLSSPASFGASIQLRWVVGGTSPSFTQSVSIIGK